MIGNSILTHMQSLCQLSARLPSGPFSALPSPVSQGPDLGTLCLDTSPRQPCFWWGLARWVALMRPWTTGLGEKALPLLRVVVPVEPAYLLLLQLLLGIFFLLVPILPGPSPPWQPPSLVSSSCLYSLSDITYSQLPTSLANPIFWDKLISSFNSSSFRVGGAFYSFYSLGSSPRLCISLSNTSVPSSLSEITSIETLVFLTRIWLIQPGCKRVCCRH